MAAPQLDRIKEERRLVTALFCDLVGFTPLAERLDAEAVRNIQTRYFESMSGEISRFGGKVEKFAGDAVLALFGIPVAREADAERAVHCALAMQTALAPLAGDVAHRWGVHLALRVGVNTGEAVSGSIDAGGLTDYAVVTGDVVNTAARLQTSAEHGSIMVGADTMRLSQRSVRFDEKRDLRLKGKTAPVAAYPVIGLRQQVAERWESGERHTPFVGRAHEVDTLLQAWERTTRDGGQLVMLVGEAGIGKSRLLAEISDKYAAKGRLKDLRARCLNYGQNVSLSLVADLLRALVGVGEQDEAPRIELQVAASVQSLLKEQDRDVQEAAIDVLGEVLGLAPGDSVVTNAGALARRQTLVKSLRLLLAGLGRETPVLMVLEDLHWIDAGSSEVLAALLIDVSDLPLLTIAAHRPDWTPPWHDWSWVERLTLRPLQSEDAISLAQAVTGNFSLSPELQQYMADRAGGNPFYIEELLQALQDAGGIVVQDGLARLIAPAAERLPASLTEIVLARLDRLDEQVRSLVQVASVIGRSFAVDLLAETAGRSLEDIQAPLGSLARAEIALPRTGLRPEYVFKHVTLRDVAYNTLLQKRRQELHGAVAEAVEMLYATDELVEVVAYHYALSENHEKAATWLERAGDRAADMYANQLAISHYEEARKRRLRLGSGGEELARLADKLGRTFAVIAWYDEAIDELEDAAGRYRVSGDIERFALTSAEIGRVHFLRGADEDAIHAVRAVLEEEGFGAAHPSPAALAALHVALVEPFHHARNFDQALEAADAAVTLVASLGDPAALSRAQVRRCLALQGVGRLEEAESAGEQAIEQSRRAGDLESLARALIWTGEVCLARARVSRAIACFEHALKVDEDRGDLAETAYVQSRLGHTLYVHGDWPRALALMERSAELVQSISFTHFSASVLTALGKQYLVEGDTERASRYLEEPLTIAERSGQRELIPYLHVPLAHRDLFEGRPDAALERLVPLIKLRRLDTPADHEAMRTAAEALLRTGDMTDAHALVDDGLSRSSHQGNLLAMAEWLHMKALVAAEQESKDIASGALDEALEIYRAAPYSHGEAQLLNTYGMLHIAQQEVKQGHEALQSALDIFLRLGARPEARRVQQALTTLEDRHYSGEPV